MLSVELKVNGVMVGHIYGRNISGNDHMYCSEHIYRWEYYKPEQRQMVSGTVKHIRDDGIEKLISLILKEVENA